MFVIVTQYPKAYDKVNTLKCVSETSSTILSVVKFIILLSFHSTLVRHKTNDEQPCMVRREENETKQSWPIWRCYLGICLERVDRQDKPVRISTAPPGNQIGYRQNENVLPLDLICSVHS